MSKAPDRRKGGLVVALVALGGGALAALRVLPAKAAAALVVALAPLLLVVPHADAAAYYVGGGQGVRLAVRVVDRQIVWSKVAVREHCLSTHKGAYVRTETFEGLTGPIAIGGRGAFRWAYQHRKHTKKGFRSLTVQDISGRIGRGRLVGRLLYYSWFDLPESGAHVHGDCRGGAGTRPSDPPAAVPITARRHPEPQGTAFYYGGKRRGITTLFEVRVRRIVKAQTWATLYCTDPDGNRYYSRETKGWHSPIKVDASGRFEASEVGEELPFETLEGEVRPDRITGRYGYSYAYRDGRRCRTGWFEPGHGRSWAVQFTALRR